MPQHLKKARAEVSITTTYGRTRALLIAADVPELDRPIVAQNAIETTKKIDGLLDDTTKTGVEKFDGALPGFVTHLRKWGKAGVVKVCTKTTPQLEERGITCMFVGYAEDHAGDCYEMFNQTTRRIIQVRDVQWLGCNFYPPHNVDVMDVYDGPMADFDPWQDLVVPPDGGDGNQPDDDDSTNNGYEDDDDHIPAAAEH